MAQSYDRRINLYINIDGKQVNNNVKSIRAEMTKLVNAQKMMTIGSNEYNAATQKIRYLNGILAQHSNEVRNVQKSWSMSSLADGFNRYMGMITAFAASFAGIIIGFKQIVKTFNDFEERVDNLSALTGLAGDELDWLSQKAKDLSTATLEGGIRVTQSAQEIVDAFTKTGSARPELLKNREALVAVTQEAIILANAAKIDLYPAIEALTMVMNQYNVGADQARRIINVLAAGSKEGAGEVDYLTVAYEKAGTVASLANISIESLGAAIETLAPRITQPEIAGRSLKGVILDLQTGADDTNPAIVGLSTALENLADKNLSVTELTKKFGTENIATAQILLRNVEELKNYEKAMTGTNVAIEQASINTDNNNAKLAQARNRLNVMSIDLGEKLAPALQVSTNSLSYLIKGLTVTIDFFNQNKVVIVSTITALTAYTVATKLSAVWEARANKEKLTGIVIGKLQTFWYNAQFASIALYNSGLALLKGNLAGATIQFRAFSAALAANPIGLFIGLIAAAGTALYFYSAKLTGVQKAQVMLNDIQVQAQKNIVEEKVQLGMLLDLARNEKLSKDERIKAITQLNALSPKMLGFLTLENINTKEATEATRAYTESLLQNAKAQAAKEKLIEIEKELLDLQSGKGADISLWQGAWNGIKSGGNLAAMSAYNASTAISNLSEKQEELNIKKEKLLAITRKQAEEELMNSVQENGGEKKAEDLIKLKEKELQAINERVAATPAEVAARNREAEALQNEINKLRELGTAKGGKSRADQMKEDAAKALAVLDEANNERMARLVIQYEKEGWSDEQFKAQQLSAELAYLTLKKAMLEQFGQSTLQTEAQISQKRIDMQKSINSALTDSEKELFKEMEASAKFDEAAIKKSMDSADKFIDLFQKQKEDEKQILEERKQAYIQFALAVGQSFGDLMMDQEATFGDYLRNTILMALEAFHQWFLIEKMKTIIEGIRGGPVAAAVAIAKVAAMEVAYQGVRAAVANSGKKAPGRAKGGLMRGEQTYTVSEEGDEWIAPNWQLRNPFTARIIAGLEEMRQNPYSVSTAALQVSKNSGSTGNSTFTQSTSTGASTFTKGEFGKVQNSPDSTLSNRLATAIERLMEWEPAIAVETYEKKRKKYDEITNGGLK